MTAFWIALGVIAFALVVFLLYILAIKPAARRHPTVEKCLGSPYAHRGLYNMDEGVPENSLTAYDRAASAGFGMELDVRLSRDKKLVIMHDANIKRMTGADVTVAEVDAAELAQYRLRGTDEHIPFLHEVLETVGGRVPLLIELKITGSDYPELCRLVCDLLDSYQGDFMLESFDPRAIRWLRRNRPELARGQLSTFYNKHGDHMPALMDFCLRNYLFNFATRPDFLAMHYEDRLTASVRRSS